MQVRTLVEIRTAKCPKFMWVDHSNGLPPQVGDHVRGIDSDGVQLAGIVKETHDDQTR